MQVTLHLDSLKQFWGAMHSGRLRPARTDEGSSSLAASSRVSTYMFLAINVIAVSDCGLKRNSTERACIFWRTKLRVGGTKKLPNVRSSQGE